MTSLRPLFKAADKNSLNSGLDQAEFQKQLKFQEELVAQATGDDLLFSGVCLCCNQEVKMLIDSKWGGSIEIGKLNPNWRERIECPQCHMNNRQRLMATLVKQFLLRNKKSKVYFMEKVTPIFNWSVSQFPGHSIVGSEYLGYDYKGGTVINGIRHEDVKNLSFKSNNLDLIVSNDVFEHVPDPFKAFQECVRVLKYDGVMLATIPFHGLEDKTIFRAELTENGVKHLLPAQFHGNPVSPEGALVFNDFGWDILEMFKEAGFLEANIEVYSSEKFGHLGGGQLIFFLSKGKQKPQPSLMGQLKKLFRN